MHNHYRDSNNKFRNPFGHSKDEIIAELKRLIKSNLKKQRQPKLNKNASKATSPQTAQSNSSTPKNNTLKTSSSSTSNRNIDDSSKQPPSDNASPEDPSSEINSINPPSFNNASTNTDSSKTDPKSPTSAKPPSQDITIQFDTTDESIANMSFDNAVSECYRIHKSTQHSLTLDTVLNMGKKDIELGLKQARNNLYAQSRFSLTQFHLTAATPGSTIEILNVAQCIFALTKYFESKNIVPDDKYMRSLTKHQLLIEITNARDVLSDVKTSNPTASTPSQTATIKKIPFKNQLSREQRNEN